MIEATTIQKYKKYTLAKLIQRLQNLVNAYVRRRDQINESGDFVCISCGKLKPKNQCNAGHFYSRGNYASLRFDLDNIHSQCIQCNMHLHGNLIPYRENLIKKIGLNRFEKLEILSKIPFKYDRFYLIEMIEKYKQAV